MRPPASATPPVGKVISSQFQPVSALMCNHDWRDLTYDSSIQIVSLETSQCLHESLYQNRNAESLNHHGDISNQLKFIDTIISPRQDNNALLCGARMNGGRVCDGNYSTSQCTHGSVGHSIDGEYLTETLVSLDSLTRQYGDMVEARIIFTPKCEHTETQYSQWAAAQTVHQHSKQRFTRKCYSDSDIVCGTNIHTDIDIHHASRQTAVRRSTSLKHTEYHRENTDRTLIEPLLPRGYKSKIGGVKRIPSIRETIQPVQVARTRVLIPKCKAEVKDQGNATHYRPHVKRKSPDSLAVPNSKIAKLVQSGLKSVIKTKDSFTVNSVTPKEKMNMKIKSDRKRQRTPRYGSGIGGLSDFLRRSEKRKGFVVVPSDVPEQTMENCDRDIHIDLNNDSICPHESANEHSTEYIDTVKAPRPAMRSRRLHNTGTSDLKLTHCQRKLVFQTNTNSPKINSDYDPLTYADNYLFDEANDVLEAGEQVRKRPRLGLLGMSKPVSVMPIDDLEVNVVRDLKRRIERANRRTRIKTNGSLKMNQQVAAVEMSVVVSPKRRSVLYANNSMLSSSLCVKSVRVKRESIV